ncbi:MAG: sugar transferase [Bryobacteraceae bacterium]
MLGRLVPITILALVVSESVLIASMFVLAVYLIADIDPVLWLVYENGLWRILVLTGIIVFALYFQDLYSRFRVANRTLLVQQICLGLGVGFLTQAMFSYVAPALLLPRWIMMIGSLLLLVTLPVWRVLYSAAVTQGLAAERVLMVGASPISIEIAEAIRTRPELGMALAGFVLDGPPPAQLSSFPVLGNIEDFRRIVADSKPSRVIVGLIERRQRMPVRELLDVKFSGVVVEYAATTYEALFGRVSSQNLQPSQLIFSSELGPRPPILRLQNIYSFAFALIGVILAAPIMLIVAILVKLTSKGPALYRQRRVGMHGEIFTVMKFRSMRQDAEAKTGAVWARRGDPRITAFGRFMRKTRLDELPQLFNVLRGEMSMVGPRPERPEFVTELSEKIPFYRQRHFVKPGITGWAQINHKYGDSIEDTITKLEYDLYYLKNLSPALDLYIMFHTVKTMLLSRGAQ